jgi:hypothetical protein
VGLQERGWNSRGFEPVGEYIFFYGKGKVNHVYGTGIFLHMTIISSLKRVEFVSDWMSYILLRRVLVVLVAIQPRIFLSSCLLDKSVKIGICKSVILPVILYGLYGL